MHELAFLHLTLRAEAAASTMMFLEVAAEAAEPPEAVALGSVFPWPKRCLL